MGGEAKWRRDEIAELKRRSPEESAQWRQLQNDKRRIANGIDPESEDPELIVAMARALSALFKEATRAGNVDAAVTLLYNTIDATLCHFSDVPAVACKKGCSHCCHIWVSVTAPEVLHIAKIVGQRSKTAIEKVRLASEHTKNYDFNTRYHHPYPCPLLEDHACSIYDVRPEVCRFAASVDAEICDRTYHKITNEGVPIPVPYVMGRDLSSIAMAAGLRHANLPYHTYEFSTALRRALETDNAEQRWLAGEDIFAGIHRDVEDIFEHSMAHFIYDRAFSTAP
jgi:Fe-S-cluster containining protein